MSKIGTALLEVSSRAIVRAPLPGAGIDRPALSLTEKNESAFQVAAIMAKTHVEVEVNPTIPRIGHPSSKAVLALITT
jgi:hypothetical protein